MKREELLALGISEDVIDKIMSINGADIEREKGKATQTQQEKEALQEQLNTVQASLSAFDGVDIDDLRGQVQKLNGDLQQAREAHQVELGRLQRKAETNQFIAGKKFVNEATRVYYAQQLETALDAPENAHKNRDELFTALTTGEDGKALPNIFSFENPNPVEFPPMGPVPGLDNPNATPGMQTLRETNAQLNAHRIVK